MIENDVHTIELKRFRKQYLAFTVAYCTIVAIAWVLEYSKLQFHLSPLTMNKLKWGFIGLAFFLSMLLSNLQRRKMKQILQMKDFEAKTDEYYLLQRQRLLANLITGSLTCMLYIFTSRGVFLGLSLFYLVILAMFYPNPKNIRRELQQEDIDFI